MRETGLRPAREEEKGICSMTMEEIGKKITDAGQGVARKTKDLTEEARLNGMIAEKKKQIDRLYRVIGQTYYERYKDSGDALAADSIREINTLTREIGECRRNIDALRGIATCPNCGAFVPEDALFCHRCGTRLG